MGVNFRCTFTPSNTHKKRKTMKNLKITNEEFATLRSALLMRKHQIEGFIGTDAELSQDKEELDTINSAIEKMDNEAIVQITDRDNMGKKIWRNLELNGKTTSNLDWAKKFVKSNGNFFIKNVELRLI